MQQVVESMTLLSVAMTMFGARPIQNAIELASGAPAKPVSEEPIPASVVLP
jgi:hypothetical protein